MVTFSWVVSLSSRITVHSRTEEVHCMWLKKQHYSIDKAWIVCHIIIYISLAPFRLQSITSIITFMLCLPFFFSTLLYTQIVFMCVWTYTLYTTLYNATDNNILVLCKCTYYFSIFTWTRRCCDHRSHRGWHNIRQWYSDLWANETYDRL